jgi:uncharacterized membrane protein YjdF
VGKSYGKEQRVGELFLRRFTPSELRQIVAAAFTFEKVAIRYEENLFHPELGLKPRNAFFDRVERFLETRTGARVIARQLVARAVK